jgi:hypothetical protein
MMHMKTKDILTITTVAVGTAVLTVTTFWTGPMEAGIDAEGPPAKIAQPKLACHGVEMTLAPPGGRTFKAGDQPKFELTAVNKTDQAASAKVCVRLTSSAPASPLSRAMVMPQVLWQQEEIVMLKANETKVIPLTARTNLPANALISVQLRNLDSDPIIAVSPLIVAGPNQSQSSQHEIVALSFSTVVPPLPAVASFTLTQ